jgi:hypothetical protein
LPGHAVAAGLAAVRLLWSAVRLLPLLWSAVRLLLLWSAVRLLPLLWSAVRLLWSAVRLLWSAVGLLPLLWSAVRLLLRGSWLLGRTRVAGRVAARRLSVAWSAKSAGLHDGRVSAPGSVTATG